MLRPFSSSPSHVKKESRKPSFRFDDLFSDEEDCVLSSPPLKRVAITPPVALSGVETYWLAEEPDSVSLLVLRNPNVRCTVTCPSQDTISLAWSCGVPLLRSLVFLEEDYGWPIKLYMRRVEPSFFMLKKAMFNRTRAFGTFKFLKNTRCS